MQVHHAGFIAMFQGLVCSSGGFDLLCPILECHTPTVHHSACGFARRTLIVEDHAHTLKDLGILLLFFFFLNSLDFLVFCQEVILLPQFWGIMFC